MSSLYSFLAQSCLVLSMMSSHGVDAFSSFPKLSYSRRSAISTLTTKKRLGVRGTLLVLRISESSGTDRGLDGNTQNASEIAHAEAEELRRRAKELKAEAKAMEIAMLESRSTDSKRKKTVSDDLIDELLTINRTTLSIAEQLREERWSPENLIGMVDRIHERQVQAMGRASSTSTTGFQIADTRNSGESNSEEYNRLKCYLHLLMDAARLLDEEHQRGMNPNSRWTGRVNISLYSRLRELRRADDQAFQKRLSSLVNSNEFMTRDGSIEDFTRQSLGLANEGVFRSPRSGNMNISAILELGETIPPWFPRSFIPLYSGKKGGLDPKDIKTIEKEVLAGTEFFCTSSESIPYAGLFRGNLRTRIGLIDSTMQKKQTARIFDEINEKLENAGLSGRVQLFFMNDPEWRGNTVDPGPKPVILALSRKIDPAVDRAPRQFGLAPFSSALSVLLSFVFAVSCYALNPIFFASIQQDLTPLISCMPLFAGILAIQAIHELAHRYFAFRSGTQIGLPVLLPSTQLGTFGSITPLRSFPRDRPALFDFSLSGPLAGMLASVASIVGGSLATIHASADALSRFPVTPAVLFKSSYLTGALISFFAPKVMLLPLSQPVPMHPLFFIGFTGLLSNALNMLPVSQTLATCGIDLFL